MFFQYYVAIHHLNDGNKFAYTRQQKHCAVECDLENMIESTEVKSKNQDTQIPHTLISESMPPIC